MAPTPAGMLTLTTVEGPPPDPVEELEELTDEEEPDLVVVVRLIVVDNPVVAAVKVDDVELLVVPALDKLVLR